MGPVDNLEDAPPDPDPRPSELSDDFVYDCMTLIVDYAECCGRLPWTSRRRSSPYFAARHLEGMARVKDELLNSLWYGVRDLDDIDSSVFRAPGEES